MIGTYTAKYNSTVISFKNRKRFIAQHFVSVVLSSAMEDNKEKLAARAIVDIDYTTLLFCSSKIHAL